MGQLERMQLFTKIVELGSITNTANKLNMAKSAVSTRLSELERTLGVKLIQRTTRKSHLTEAGTLYYQKCKLLLGEIDDLNNQLSTQKQNLSGTLKIAVPLSFGISHLMPAIDEFLGKHEHLKLDIHFSDRKVDIIEEGFDLAFRIGQLNDSSLRARKITSIKHVLCASPEYLAKRGTPTNVSDLKTHKFLKYSDLPSNGFVMKDVQGKSHTVNFENTCIANNGDFLKAMAVSGHGITLLPTFITWQEIATGKLLTICKDYELATMQAYALFPDTQYLPSKVRLLIEFLVERFGDCPYWDKS